jgi:D-aminopeptidase
VRTGVTVVVPPDDDGAVALFAGSDTLNGNGEMTGLEWIREAGQLSTPIGLTNTHSVGVVRDALVAAAVRRRVPGAARWSLPVVGETWDGLLNDIDGQHVRAEHVEAALEGAGSDVEEGNVGGGAGMVCHGFKGGIGTASRLVTEPHGGYTVGALVQANYGRRERLSIAGIPVGRLIGYDVVPRPPRDEAASIDGAGSIIVILATDAPLLPHQCSRLAKRAGLGVARMGGVGDHTSGDIFLAFATGNRGLPPAGAVRPGALTHALTALDDVAMTPLFDAAVEATEAAIANALLAARTMTGRDGFTVHAIPHDRLLSVMGGEGDHADRARTQGAVKR